MGGEIDLVGFGEFGHTNGMSQRATDRRIPPELESEISPAVRAFVGSLLPPESIDQPHDDARMEMPWEQVDQARAPSVVMILKIR